MTPSYLTNNFSNADKKDDGEHSDSEWLTKPPSYYNVKKANISPSLGYKYDIAYKQNKDTGRILRYYICKYSGCGRKFNKTWNFVDHVRIHTGEKPYVCHICKKGFTQKGNYNKHMSNHGMKPGAANLR